MKKNKVIYYNDELNDEFSTAVIEPRIIDEKYKYINSDFINIVLFCVGTYGMIFRNKKISG